MAVHWTESDLEVSSFSDSWVLNCGGWFFGSEYLSYSGRRGLGSHVMAIAAWILHTFWVRMVVWPWLCDGLV